jgi:4-hydroxybutyrate CoA-transferase
MKSTAVSAEEALSSVRSGMRVYIQGASAVPQALVDALAQRGQADAGDPLWNVEVVHLHTNGTAPYVEPRYEGHFHHRALFVGSNTREAVADGQASYVPVFLSDVPELFRRGKLPLDAALVHLSPPDRHGFCSLGTSVDCSLAAFESAPIRIAQINPRMPRTLGDSQVHVDQLTAMVDVDTPLPEIRVSRPTEEQIAIGRHVAALIPDGATLQIGIGGIPDAVLHALSGHRDLGIHSEVLSDGVLELVKRGVVTGARKTVNPGKIVVAFLNGTRALYEFADNNPMLEMRPVDYTNDTRVILRQDAMMAINSAIEVDLTGQVCAESIGSSIYSGVGGQMDFLRGAALSNGGKPIIALASTARGGTVSRIVPTLRTGAGVTTSRAHVHYVASEYGVVDLHGLDLAERAEALIGIAHPAFREELEAAARDLHLLPTGRTSYRCAGRETAGLLT